MDAPALSRAMEPIRPSVDRGSDADQLRGHVGEAHGRLARAHLVRRESVSHHDFLPHHQPGGAPDLNRHFHGRRIVGGQENRRPG
jgi:hypothetical protein